MDDLKSYIVQIEATALLLAVSYSGALKIIQSVPGIRQFSALAIFSEIGADMSAFLSDKHLCSWAGLALPTIRVPAKRNRFASVVLAFTLSPYSFSVPMQLLGIKASPTIAHAMKRLSTVAATREPLSPLLE